MAGTRWLQVVPLQSRPMDLGSGVGGRTEVGFNVLVTKRPSDTFVGEVMAVLQTAGVGTFKVDMLGTSAADIPVGTGPCLITVATGGPSGLRRHNRAGTSYERATAQVMAYALYDPDRTPAGAYEAAEAMAWRAFHALEAVRNADVVALAP